MIIGGYKSGRPQGYYDFVRKVRVESRNRRRWSIWLIAGGWSLIVIKCILASVAIRHWDIPIADFYVWGPSFIFGGLCTFLYLSRSVD